MTIISRAAKMDAHIPEEFKTVGVVEKVIEDKRAVQSKLAHQNLLKKKGKKIKDKKGSKELAIDALIEDPSVSDERRAFQRLLPNGCTSKEYDMLDPFTLANRDDVHTDNAQGQSRALNALTNVVVRCDKIAELGGGFSQQERALARIPKAF